MFHKEHVWLQNTGNKVLTPVTFTRIQIRPITLTKRFWNKTESASEAGNFEVTYMWQPSKKAVPLRATKALGVRRYSSYSFSTSALDGDEWSVSRPGRALPPGKGPPIPIVQVAGWAPEPLWTQRLEEKSFASARYRTSITP
jgi:hypothetical protein